MEFPRAVGNSAKRGRHSADMASSRRERAASARQPSPAAGDSTAEVRLHQQEGVLTSRNTPPPPGGRLHHQEGVSTSRAAPGPHSHQSQLHSEGADPSSLVIFFYQKGMYPGLFTGPGPWNSPELDSFSNTNLHEFS